MSTYSPQRHIRCHQADRREHLFCASLLAFCAALCALLYYGVLTHPFAPHSPNLSFVMLNLARVALGLIGGVSAARAVGDLWQAFGRHREIQGLNWLALSVYPAERAHYYA